LEKLYTKVHEEIRKNPERPKKADKKKQEVKYVDKSKSIVQTTKAKYRRDRRLTKKERKERAEAKIKKAFKGKWWEEGFVWLHNNITLFVILNTLCCDGLNSPCLNKVK